MTSAAKITYFIAFLIGLSVSAFLGYKTTSNALADTGDARSSAACLALAEFSRMQYKHADSKDASAALLSYAGLLEEMEKLKPERVQEAELSNSYTRLALLQDTVGNEQESHEYMVRAGTWNVASGGHNYPEPEMKARLRALDQRMRDVEDALADSQ